MITPTPGFIVVEPYKENTSFVTVSNSNKGKVIAIGEPTYRPGSDILVTAPCKAGDIIAYSAVGYEGIAVDGKDYRIVPFQIVLGIYT